MPPERTEQQIRTRGTLLALGSAIAFSSLAIWGKLATQLALSTYSVLTFRFGIVAALLLAIAGGGLTLRDRGVLIGTGLLYVSATSCYFAALSRISAGTTALLLYLAPAFVVLYLRLLGKTSSRMQAGGIVLTLLGLGLVIGLPSATDRSVSGLGFGVATGALYGAYLLASERWLGPYRSLTSTAYMSLSAALCFAAAGAATGSLSVPRGSGQWGVTLGMVVFPTLLAVPTLYASIKDLGAARASVLATTEPLWTVLLAALVLGEPLGLTVIAGGVLILAGALLAQRQGQTG